MTNIDPRTIALGQEIRAEAAAQRITIAELSSKAGVNRSSLYTWLDGKANFPLDGLVRVADVLRVAPHDLLHRGEDRAR
ncbi:TPA: helix-turn-helix transcriptional regulator, partial [Shigella flexneri]|nr:helix-turn-helix transcriptional regulator [Shigella flexneri]